MIPILFAAEEAEATGIKALGISPSAFVIQLITFVLVFLLLKRFAFTPIVKMLEQRRQVIDDGIRLGQKLEKERDQLNEEVARVMRETRHEADKIIANSHKEAREVIREAEKTAQRKADTMITDAEARIHEESQQARRRLEKDLVGLVSEATEAVVGEKIDSKKDAELIENAVRSRLKK